MKVLLMVLVLGTALQSTAQNQQPPAVKHLYRIMVAGFVAQHPWEYTSAGKEEEMVRSKLVSSLSRQCKQVCVVTEQAFDDDTKVDAVLSGSWQISDCWNCTARMQGAMRLVAKDGTVLWSDTVYSTLLARSITSSFADNVAKKLVSHLASKTLPATGE